MGNEDKEGPARAEAPSSHSPFPIPHSPFVRLFLTGARGSGKSTVAGLLAARLGWAAIDADGELEARAGASIRELFALRGEAHFRDLEASLLAELARREGVVVATGGGVVLRPENRALLRRGGPVVWLRASPEVLWARVAEDPSSSDRRPNLAGGGLDEMRRVLEAREALYRECAHHAVETTGRSPEEVADEVFAWWSGRAGRERLE
jgi:shikimate kinase